MFRKLPLILRFYYSAMFWFNVAVSLGFACLVTQFGARIIPASLLGKAVIYPLYLYVWLIPRFDREFHYYQNLGVSRHRLLITSCSALWTYRLVSIV